MIVVVWVDTPLVEPVPPVLVAEVWIEAVVVVGVGVGVV
jgi:hypothetical protein